MKTIYLASQSPQRKKILGDLLAPYKIPFYPVVPEFLEHQSGQNPKEIALLNAKGKAYSLTSKCNGGSVIIGSDTIVHIDNKILGKPETKKDAREYLRTLSGKRHSVYTAICVLDNDKAISHEGCVESVITFYNISTAVLEEYVNSNEPFGKAGGYAIQGVGKKFIETLEGSYSNVVGLPKELMVHLLIETGIIQGK